MKTADDYYEEIDKAATVASPLFQMYGWTYGGEKIPTHDKLVSTIKSLVESVLDRSKSPHFSGHAGCATGRFNVTYDEYSDESHLTISLELAEKAEFK